MNHLTRNVANLVKKETAEFCQVEISEMFVETNIKKASYQFIETLRFAKKKKKKKKYIERKIQNLYFEQRNNTFYMISGKIDNQSRSE